MAREIELKLAFPPEARRYISRHPLIAATTRVGRAQTLENTYYDTPDEALGKALIAVRTRRIGRRWLQTIKSANTSAGGLSSRPEWEHPFNHRENRFDFSLVDDATTRTLLEQHADSIKPLFTTNFHRETREYAPRPGLRILLMIDTGTVSCGGEDGLRTAPISELELELVEGEAGDLLDYALQLGADLPLMPEDVSKAQRGYQLLHNEQTRALRARSVALKSSVTPREAFLVLAFECLQGWQANALGALTHDDPEFIHQLRVALRRLRTLLRIFAAQLPEGFAERWQAQFGQLANDVGLARDLDVMHDSLLQEPSRGPDAPAFEALIEYLRDASRVARTKVRTVLHSADARILLLQFSKALHTLPAAADSPDMQIFAHNCLRKLRKQVANRLKQAQKTGERNDLHRVRIALKRLRYALEFFVSLFDERLAKPYLRKLGKVLGELGELNDVAVGRGTLRQWAQTQENLREISIWIAGWHAASEQRRSHRVLEDTADLLDMSAPWKKSRNVKASR
jgi:adenylate cyclase